MQAHKNNEKIFPRVGCRSLYTNSSKYAYVHLWVLPTTSCNLKGHVPFKMLYIYSIPICLNAVLYKFTKNQQRGTQTAYRSIPSPCPKLKLTPFPSRPPRSHFNQPRLPPSQDWTIAWPVMRSQRVSPAN